MFHRAQNGTMRRVHVKPLSGFIYIVMCIYIYIYIYYICINIIDIYHTQREKERERLSKAEVQILHHCFHGSCAA